MKIDFFLEAPCRQYLGGMRHFQHSVPPDPSSMGRWRKRAGQAGLEELLAETIRVGLRIKAVKASQPRRVNPGSTVEEKQIRHPADSRPCDRARGRLVKEAEHHGIQLRQNYKRLGKNLLMQQQRHAHDRQFKRARRCQKKLRTLPGRVIRDIEGKGGGLVHLAPLATLLKTAKAIHTQQRNDKNKTYSASAPGVECIGKGKAHKRYRVRGQGKRRHRQQGRQPQE